MNPIYFFQILLKVLKFAVLLFLAFLVFIEPGFFAALGSTLVLHPLYQILLTTLLLGAFLYWVTAPKKTEEKGTHGSATWGTDRPFRKNNEGLLLGRSLDTSFSLTPSSDTLLRFNGEGHLLTVAKTRSGKGVGSVIPNLLMYPGSVVVTDLKGENFAVTSSRRKALGQMVAGLDPFDLVGGSARFNPLDLIDPDSDDAMDDANMIANTLVIPENVSDPHWNKEAHALLAGLILYVCQNYSRDKRTLTQVRHLLTLHPNEFEALLDEMLAEGGLIRRAAARLLQKSDRERSGVISSAQSHTHFLDSPRTGWIRIGGGCVL